MAGRAGIFRETAVDGLKGLAFAVVLCQVCRGSAGLTNGGTSAPSGYRRIMVASAFPPIRFFTRHATIRESASLALRPISE